jgi:hypothetical protein
MLWEYIWSAAMHLLDMIVIGGLGWSWWKQNKRIQSLVEELSELNSLADQLQDECSHQASLAWSRLSDAEKDAAIRMG